MIVSDIQTRVKRQFGDEAGVQITDADIIRYINDGQRKIVSQNESLLQKITTTASVNGQDEYAMPVDSLILRSVSYKSPTDLSYYKLKGLTLSEFDEYVNGWDGDAFGSSTPLVFMLYGSNITLFPKPDHDFADAIKIYYTRVPTDVANPNDVPDLPVLYHEVLVQYCMSQAYIMDEDIEAAAAMGNQIQGDMTLLRGRSEWNTQESYPTITIRAEDY